MQIGHRKEFLKLTFQGLALRQSEWVYDWVPESFCPQLNFPVQVVSLWLNGNKHLIDNVSLAEPFFIERDPLITIAFQCLANFALKKKKQQKKQQQQISKQTNKQMHWAILKGSLLRIKIIIYSIDDFSVTSV